MFMLRYIVYFILFCFSECLWADSSSYSDDCSAQLFKKTICPLQRKLYVDLGVSKILSAHLSSRQIQIIKNEENSIDFGVYSEYRDKGILPDTLQIGIGYAWLQNSANGGVFPYVSVGVDYRQINAIHSPLTLTGKIFYTNDKDDFKGSISYESIPLENSNLFATVRFNPIKIGCMYPYVSAGLGVSWTQAHNQKLKIFKRPVLRPPMDGDFQLPAIKQTNIGFRLGSGVDFILTQNLLMSIGYSYNDLGKIDIRKSYIFMNFEGENKRKFVHDVRPLHLGNLTSHNIELSLRYLFP